MLGRADREGGAETHQYSTGDYCESPDSSMRHEGRLDHPVASPRCLYRLPAVPRCLRKHFRIPAGTCYHLPKAVHSFPNRRLNRSGGRRTKRVRALDETTSLDEHKSITSYSSMLTVDVTREMEAVNRDIEEIMRRCDDYCMDGHATCKACCRHHHRRPNKAHMRSLTQDQMRILSMKRPPLDKLKEVPLSYLKPRPPRHPFKEKSLSAPHAKYKTSRDIRNIVEETDALLRNVYKELSRGKRQDMRTEDEGCLCEGTRGVSEPRAATCLERYLGCQNKCRRIHENRWFKPKWRDVLEKGDFYRTITPNEDRTKHYHDTNCISEPTTSSCLVRTRKESQNVLKMRSTKDTGVNTEYQELLIKSHWDDRTNSPEFSLPRILNKETFRNGELSEDKKYSLDFQSVKAFVNYASDNLSGRSNFKSSVSDHKKSVNEDIDGFRSPKDEDVKETRPNSLLLDRDMGISLSNGSDLKTVQTKTDIVDSGVQISSNDLEPHMKSPRLYFSQDFLRSRSSNVVGAGDSATALESSKTFLCQIINKIVNKPLEWSTPSHNTGKEDTGMTTNDEVDSSICLEIMRRLVDLMNRHHQSQLHSFKELPTQYARVRKMKQQHLVNIEKEINCIQDLEFYLKNASPARN